MLQRNKKYSKITPILLSIPWLYNWLYQILNFRSSSPYSPRSCERDSRSNATRERERIERRRAGEMPAPGFKGTHDIV